MYKLIKNRNCINNILMSDGVPSRPASSSFLGYICVCKKNTFIGTSDLNSQKIFMWTQMFDMKLLTHEIFLRNNLYLIIFIDK